MTAEHMFEVECKCYEIIQVGQLSQTNRAAAWVSFGENISAKIVHVTSLYLTAQKILRNAEPFRRAHQLLPIFK